MGGHAIIDGRLYGPTVFARIPYSTGKTREFRSLYPRRGRGRSSLIAQTDPFMLRRSHIWTSRRCRLVRGIARKLRQPPARAFLSRSPIDQRLPTHSRPNPLIRQIPTPSVAVCSLAAAESDAANRAAGLPVRRPLPFDYPPANQRPVPRHQASAAETYCSRESSGSTKMTSSMAGNPSEVRGNFDEKIGSCGPVVQSLGRRQPPGGVVGQRG
jgi:hypothetical protein